MPKLACLNIIFGLTEAEGVVVGGIEGGKLDTGIKEGDAWGT